MSSGSKRRKRLPEPEVRYAGQRRRNRSGLMATTALQAGAILLLAFPMQAQPVQAQPAPSARPQGGTLVGGQAAIAQTTTQTTIAQSTQRAAIDWRSFDIGQAHTVTYQQPNASSITLNRVTGPDPSQIAGRIQANGQVAIVNQSGVLFMKGSQVDVQSLIVSSANIANHNFMAGKMVFDQPGRPDAKITNAGTITVKATGLAALVAPQVQNAGVINARLGHVVLAGAEAHTVDLYGDGLMSVDVTRQVQKAPNGQTVLVTNSGTIAADGGTILLTASAADGIVTNLVSNTGRLRANSVGDKPGAIVVSAVGGSISIEGPIEANGRAPNSPGGTITLAATDTVALGPAARVAANGRAGGGTVAIGTTPDRARNQSGGIPANAARTVTVAQGARIAANGTGTGTANGGSIALLATDKTTMAGTITARGGKRGGDGGQVEVSSANKFALTGTIDVGAPAGKPGNILIDPQDIAITPSDTVPPPANDPQFTAGAGTINASENPTTDYTISDSIISSFTGNVTLRASRNLFVSAGVTVNLTAGSPPQALTLQAGNNLVVSGGDTQRGAASITASGNITLTAGTTNPTGAATIAGALSSTQGLVRVASDGSAGAVNIYAPASGALVQVAAASVNLAAGLSALATGQPIAISANALTINAPLSTLGGAGTVALAPFTPNTPITIEAVKNTTAGLSLTPADLALLAPPGALARLNLGDITVTPGAFPAIASTIAFNTATPIAAPTTLGLYATGGITQTDALTVATLTGVAATATLNNPTNALTTLGPFSTSGTAAFTSNTPLTVTGAVSGSTVQLAAPSLALGTAITTPAGGKVGLNTNALTLGSGAAVTTNGGTVAIAPFTPGTDLRVETGTGSPGLSLDPAAFTTLAPATPSGPALFVLGDTAAIPSSAAAQAANIVLNNAFILDAPVLSLYATNSVTQTNPFSVATLTGASGAETNLTTAGNRITTLGRYTAGTNASFRSDAAFTVDGPVTATNGTLALLSPASLTTNGPLAATAVALQANTLNVNNTTTVTANTIAVAPFSGGTALTVEATKGFTPGLSLTPTDLGTLAATTPTAPTTLNLGLTPTSTTAGNIAINTPLTVNPATLGLYTTGTITQTDPLTVGTLTGNANSSATLTTSNAIGALGSFTTGGPLSLINGATPLSVTGPVAASGDILLQSNTALAISGNLYSTGAIRLRTNGTFTQSAGIVAAAGGDLFVTGIAADPNPPDLTPTGGTISQTGGTLATTGRLRLYSGADATFTGSGILGANDIEVIALGANTFAATTGRAAIETDPTLAVTLSGRPATLRLDGATITIGRAIAANAVELHSTGNTTEPGGSITADTLTGTAGLGATVLPIALPSYVFPSTGSALLNNTTNAVTTLGPYTARTGFTLDNGATPLTANAPVTVTTGALALRTTNLTLNGSVLLSAPRIELAADAITNAPGQLNIPTTGSLALAPYTPGPYTIGPSLAGETAISLAQIQSLLPAATTPATTIALLQLGGTSTTPGAAAAVAPSSLTPSSLTPTETLTINTALDLTTLASTLALNGRTAITQTADHPVTVATLTGATNGQFLLDASPSPPGPFYARTFNNLIPQLGAITAGADSSIATNTNLATLSGTTITAGTANITLTTPGAIALGGTLGAGSGIGSVTLQAVTGITQPTGTIQTGTLTGAVGNADPTILTGRNALLTNPANQITTLGNFTTTQGNLSLIDNQALTVAAGATITGRNVALTTNGTALAMTINGAIGACATTADGTVTLTSTGALTIAGPGAIVGGERATNLAGASNTVAAGAFVESGRSGTPAYDGTITITNRLALQDGTVAAATILAPDGIDQTGGILSATNLNPGAYTLAGGQVYSGTPIALTATALAANDVITAPSLLITTTPGFTAAGTIVSPGNIQIIPLGDFTQTAGQIYAGDNLAISRPSNTAAPGLITQSGGLLASTNTTELYAAATGAVSIAGTLAGQSIQVIEPAATMTFAPALLTTATATPPGYTVQFHCPGCETPTALPNAITTPATITLSGTTPLIRVDAGTLTLAAPVTANTVELHSVGNTTQTAPITTGATGILTGTAGYAVTRPATGLPTWDTPTTLGSATLTNPLNTIPTAGPDYTGGSLAITSNTPTFTARDNLVAGGGQSIALTNSQPNGLLLIDGVNSGFLGFGAIRGGSFATNPHLNIRGIGALTPSTVSAATAPSQIILTADQLSITAPGPGVQNIDARGGTVSIAPFSPNRPLSIDSTRIPGATLSLGAPDLTHINTLGTTADVGLLGPRTLRLGSTDGTLANAAATLTLNTNLALTNQAATLALYAQGAITESPTGGLTIGRAGLPGTLTGAAGAAVTLGTTSDTTPPNHFDILGPFTAGAGLTVSDTPDANAGRSGLLVQGTVSSGTGPLGLLDVGQVLAGTRLGGTIAIGTSTTPATLDATNQTLTLIAQNGPATAPAITEAANSTIRAATLTGRASTNDPAPPTTLAYDVRLDASTTNQIDTLGQFIVGTGPTTLVSAQGAFRLADAAPLIVNGPVIAKSVFLSANAMTIYGDIGACIVGTTGGDITFRPGPITIRSGTIGAQASILFDGDVLQTGGTVNAPTISVTRSLTENGGTLFGNTVTISGGATLNSGTLHAATLNATTTYTAGDLYADNALTVALPNPTFSGSIGSGSALTINAGPLVSTGTLYAGGTLTLNTADFNQAAGTIAARTDLTILANGIATQTGGALEAGRTLLVRASGSPDTPIPTATFAGTLAAQTVQLIEPGYALNPTPATLGGAYTVNVGPLLNTYHCPGCDTQTPSSTIAFLPPTPASSRPLNLRLDGNTLTLGTLAADNVELHAIGPTTQTGPLTALNLTGTAGYAGTPDLLPLYNPGTAQSRTPGYIVATPPANATVALTNPGNNVFAVNTYQVAGDFPSATGLNLVDRPANQTTSTGAVSVPTGLTLTGIVRAGPATDPLDATAEAASGANIGITTTGAFGALKLNGILAGNTLALNASGPITETGTLVAATLTGTAPTAAFTTPNQIANLAAFDAPGGFSLLNARNLQVTGKVSAAGGNASITAQPGTGTVSVPEGQSAGTLTIAPPPSGTDATITARNVALTGVNVIANGLVGACSIADATTGNLTIAATAGTIAINPGAILGGQTSATLTATGGVQLQGGTLNAPTLAIDALALTSGLAFGNTVTLNRPATITGGTLNATTLNTPNGLTFTNGTLNAGNALTLTADTNLSGQVTSGGTLTVNGASTSSTANLTAANLAINTTGDFLQQSGLLAATGNVTITANGVINQATPAQIEAGNTILLRAAGPGAALIQGQLAANQLQIVEPGANLVFAPTPFPASDPSTPTLRGAASVTIGTLANTFDCPGCLPATIPLSTLSATTATPGSNRPTALRVDGATIVLGTAAAPLTLGADSVELHSLGATAQAGGTLETLALSGTAGYAASAAQLPLYTLAPTTAANPTVTLDSTGNNIATLGTYQVRGDDPTRTGLTLVTTPTAQTNAAGASIAPNGLVVTGTLRAGPASNALDTSTVDTTGNNITLTMNGPGQNLQIANAALLAGNVVTLKSTGSITETGTGRIVAGSLTGTAAADVTLATTTTGAPAQGGNQIATLSAFSTPGTFTLQNSRNLTVNRPLKADSGLTITTQSGAGTTSASEGQAAGNLNLAGPISAPNITLTAYGDLTGSSPTAPGTLTLTAGNTVNVAGITAGTLTGTAGQSFTATGAFDTATNTSAVNGALTLTDTSPLLLSGASRSQADLLVAAPAITAAGTLASAQSIRLHTANGDFTQTAGTIAAATNLVIAGPSDTTALPGKITQQAGLLAAGNTLRLLATGDTSQMGGTIAAPTVQVASLSGTNTFGASQSATVTLPTASVDRSGTLPTFTLPPITPTATTLSGRPAIIRLDGNAISLTRPTAANTVELHAATNIGESPGGTITAITLQGTAGSPRTGFDPQGLPTYTTPDPAQPGEGEANLANANNIQNLGPFQARSGLILSDTSATGLTITGLVRAGLATDLPSASTIGAPLSIALAGPTLTIADNATLSGSQITLTTPGAITEAPGALILADTLSGTAATATLAPINGNQIARLGPFTTTGNLTLLDAPSLQITGPVQAGPTLTLSTAGNLDINGGSLTAATVALTATGAITETNGPIIANTLTATAAQITARAPANQVAATGLLTAPGGIDLADASSLNVTGPITATNGPVSLQTQGDLTTRNAITAPSITLNGGQSATLASTLDATDLRITAGTTLALTQASRTTANTITTQSGAATTLAGTLNAAANLGITAGTTLAFTQTSGTAANTLNTQSGAATTLAGTIAANSAANLRSNQSLTLAGTVSTPLLTAIAPAITLQDLALTTGGTRQPGTVTALNLPDAPSRSGAASATSGAFFQAANTFTQTRTTIATAPGYPNTTVRVSLTNPSTAATLSLSSLTAPTTNLILDLQNGTGTGQNIRVANFVVSYAGTGLSPGIGLLDLNGVTVGSQIGVGAASAGTALANPSRNYQINACAVGSVNCVVLRPQAVPVGNPLKELSLSFFNDQDDDRDLLVPNITDQGL